MSEPCDPAQEIKIVKAEFKALKKLIKEYLASLYKANTELYRQLQKHK